MFSPVVKFETTRFLLAHVANENWDVQQYDVKTAFLNGELSEEIYMDIPELPIELKGLVQHYSANDQKLQSLMDLLKASEKSALLLLKAIYGLRQSSRQ